MREDLTVIHKACCDKACIPVAQSNMLRLGFYPGTFARALPKGSSVPAKWLAIMALQFVTTMICSAPLRAVQRSWCNQQLCLDMSACMHYPLISSQR